MTFEQLDLIPEIRRALLEEGYTTPTPVQTLAIPLVLDGNDLIGCAQTGTGKTAAFAIPLLQLLFKHPLPLNEKKRIRALILTPTRELASQIGESITAYGKYTRLRHTVIFGGVGQRPQQNAIARGIDILVATPGRLLDLVNQRIISLRDIQYLVLDEADRMLDMGFIHDIKKIIELLPEKRQTLFFSATMPPMIVKLSSTILRNPKHVAVTPVASTESAIEQSLYFVEKSNKKHLLLYLLTTEATDSTLVFLRTKHGANRIVKELMESGISAEAIHGNKSQAARQAALQNFKNKKTRVLVATDIAARGLDIDQLSHVINYEIPNEPETYVHRIGRTGRAGASGKALSFCDADERHFLRDIQRLINHAIPVVAEHPHKVEHQQKSSAPNRNSNGNRSRPQSSTGFPGNRRNDHSRGNRNQRSR